MIDFYNEKEIHPQLTNRITIDKHTTDVERLYETVIVNMEDAHERSESVGKSCRYPCC